MHLFGSGGLRNQGEIPDAASDGDAEGMGVYQPGKALALILPGRARRYKERDSRAPLTRLQGAEACRECTVADTRAQRVNARR